MVELAKYINQVVEGDCLNILPLLPSDSIDMVLCDLPYGMTQNPWDKIIDMEKLWIQYRRVVKESGVIALSSQGLFTGKLIASNEAMFKYKIVWIKSKSVNFLNSKKQPLRRHEDICIFYNKQPVYHPQMQKGKPYDGGSNIRKDSGSYGLFSAQRKQNTSGSRYPNDVNFNEEEIVDWVYYKTAEAEGPVHHPCQKPVALGRYFIRTYSNPGDIILDNSCGCGSFLVAAVLEGRKFIGVEKNENAFKLKVQKVDYVSISRERIAKAYIEFRNESNKILLF